MIDRPWTRVRKPVPLPTKDVAAALHDMDDTEFAELLRSHLMPRAQSTEERRPWVAMWEAIRADASLTDRAYDVLEGFLTVTEDAIDAGDLDEAGNKRAKKFLTQCDAAWQRVDRVEQTKHRRKQPRAAVSTELAQVVAAIQRHRAAAEEDGHVSPHDLELWESLARLGLDK